MLLLLWGCRVAGRTCWPEPPCWTRGGGPRPPSAPRLAAASASGLSWGPWSRPGRAAAAVAWPFRVNLIMLHLDPAPSTAGGSAAPSARRRPRSCARGSAGSPPPLPGQPCLLVSRSAGSVWALGPPSHARRPPRGSALHIIRPPRDGSGHGLAWRRARSRP